MRSRVQLVYAAAVAATMLAPGATAAPMSRPDLEREAKARVQGTPRVALAPENAPIFDTLEALESRQRVPNYLRVLAATHAPGVVPMSKLVRAVLFQGAVPSETKMAMGLRIAELHSSPYVAAHMQRYLRATEQGRKALAGSIPPDSPHSLALGYAEKLTGNVNGVSKAEFQQVSAHYNDSQIVELTFTVCFFNYFTRFAETLRLPVESWALETTPEVKSGYEAPFARVSLVSDAQVEEVARMTERMRQFGAKRGPGLGLANSLRAMLLSPVIGGAWMDYMMSMRGATQLDREMGLHVSFAVSMANGCRYCTLHQVQGLRRLGVNPAKLMQMKKDDSALTPRELSAVQFARKVTTAPAAFSNADWEKAKSEFGERQTFELLLQTCTFAFMNRFTDGLQLPSEDEAIQIYREVYGGDWTKSN